MATTRSLLNPSQGNQINTALFSAKPTSNVDAPCPVEMKGLENDGPFTSVVYVCIYNIQEPKWWHSYLKIYTPVFSVRLGMPKAEVTTVSNYSNICKEIGRRTLCSALHKTTAPKSLF